MVTEHDENTALLDGSLVDVLFDENENILILADEELKIERVNHPASIYFGIPAKLLEGRDMASVLDPADTKKLQALVKILSIDGESAETTFELRNRFGDTRRQASLRQVRGGGGRRKYLFIARCRSGTKSGQSAAVDPNRLVARLLGGLVDSILHVDSVTHTIADCNSAAEALFGYPRGELIGRSPLILAASPEEAKGFAQRARESYARNGFFQEPIRCRRKDGSLFPSLATSLAIFDAEGNHVSTVTINRDLCAEERRCDEILEIAEQAEILAQALKRAVIPLKSMEPGKSLSELGFTSRQIEIAAILVRGETSKVIAMELKVSEATVKNSLSAMYRLAEVSSRMEFLRFVNERRIRIG